jgi:tetratricopeptide (TPR) repeat protein
VPGSSDWRSESDVGRISAEQRQLLDEELSEIVFLVASGFHRSATLTSESSEQKMMLLKAMDWNELGAKFESTVKSQHAWTIQKIGIRTALGLDSEHEISRITVLSTESGQLSSFSNAIQLLEMGDASAALSLLEELVQQNPHDYSAWYLLGKARQLIGRHWEADAAFSTCIALNFQCWLAWQDRAVVRLELKRYQDASTDCSQLLQLRPDIVAGYLNRSLAEIALGDYPAAEKDLDLVISKKGPTRAYFLRANVRQMQGSFEKAQADFEAGLKSTPEDCDSWVTRGMALLQNDPQRALEDFSQARRLNPKSRDALQNSAHVFSERLNKPNEAISCLDELLSLYPNDNAARIGRAVLNARAGRDDTARKDAETVLSQTPDPVTLYQVACVYALLSQWTEMETESALEHLANAMKVQPQLYSMAENDSDLNSVRSLAAFQDLLKACRSLMSPKTEISNVDAPTGHVGVWNGE